MTAAVTQYKLVTDYTKHLPILIRGTSSHLRREILVGSPVVVGPEQAPLLERFVVSLRLPYWVGCLLLSFISSPAVSLFGYYLDSRNINEAFANTADYFFGVASPTQTEIFIAVLAFPGATFLLLYSIRYIRLKIVKAEPELKALAASKESFRQSFGLISRPYPVLVGVLFFALAVFSSATPNPIGPKVIGVYSSIVVAAEDLLFFLPLSTFFWIYASSLYGVYKFGNMKLNLRPFYQDRMLGLRPVGSITFSIAFIALVTTTLGSLETAIPKYEPGSFVLGILSNLFLVVMFFLPLFRLHRRMLDQRQAQQSMINERFSTLFKNPGPIDATNSASAYADLRNAVYYDIAKKEVASLPTWPFDTRTIERLLAIVLTVTGILLARIIYTRLIPF